MERLARLPVFFALAGKRAVVAGGNPAAAWKAELLSAAGAAVEVLAPEPGEELRTLALEPPDGAITIVPRAWRAEDLVGAAIAVGACDDDEEARRFAGAARTAGVPVNVIDKPAYCDFSFGAVVNRSPLVIGVSTDGAAPVFGQAIRGKLEAMIPRGFADWAEAARRWRRAVQSSALSFAARRRFWRLFTRLAESRPEQPPAQADFDALLAHTRGEGPSPEAGTVTVIGAGNGDPQLLTMRAVRALQSADVILIDATVPPAILDFARREAKKMLVEESRDDTIARMVSLAQSGRRVVRLRAGDPAPGADAAIAACREAGIAIEVVPAVAARPDDE